MAAVGFIVNVTGTISAIAMLPVKPGSAPIIRPATVPISMNKMVLKFMSAMNPATKFSIQLNPLFRRTSP